MKTPIPKFCVFCGNKPEGKTKEHIIPQWLMKLTGDPNREIVLGVDTKVLRKNKEFKMRKHSFSSFHFPACHDCNKEFSELEAQTKIIVEKILIGDFLNASEINTLLDWFDKVRIGLWLGALLLDRDIAPIYPKFHIKKRIAEKDRCLFIYEINDDWKGIQFVGFNSPAFLFTPSCFSLCINNLHLFNISYDYLFARNIGFPFPIKQTFREEDERIFTELAPGLNKIRLPLLKRHFANCSMEIYQPMIFTKLGELMDEAKNLYDCEYVKSNCINFDNGIGSIFFMDGNKLSKLDDETELCCRDKEASYDREELMDIIARQVLETQLYLSEKLPSPDTLGSGKKSNIKSIHKSVIKMQKEFTELAKKGSR